jgi:double zinc ribbon protein
MQQDDREPDAASGAPGEPNATRDADVPNAAQASDTEEEFENAPSLNRAAESDEPQAQAVEQASDPGAEIPADKPPGPPPQEAEAYPASPAAEAEAEATAAHSVPATQVGESTQCPRCGTENRPGVAFCRNCGQRLVAAGVASTLERPGSPQGTQACPRCGTINRAGVAFCQNCGANLRASAQPAPGYVPPAAPAAAPPAAVAAAARQAPAGGAVLGPIVLLVGAIGIATAWVLPFAYGNGSLWQRSFGAVGGYGVAFWSGYSAVGGGIPDKAYFGFAAAAPILVALLVILAIAGFLRAAPGGLQVIGLVIATLWAIGLVVLFVALEIVGNWSSDIVSVLRLISPAGIIFLLASLIVLIGCATRFARS